MQTPLKIEDLDFPVVLKNISGAIVVALGRGSDFDRCIRVKIIQNNGSAYYTNGEVVENALLRLFEKYNRSVKLVDGTVLQNVIK